MIPLIQKVQLENYKSIARCDVELSDLSFLIGANGSGKSNFLDALKFVKDALRTSLDHALRERGGIGEVRHRSNGRPRHFTISLQLALHANSTAHYAFKIGAQQGGNFIVQREQCVVFAPLGRTEFEVENGVLKTEGGEVSTASVASYADRLYLVAVSALPAFRPVFEALSEMGFYNLNPRYIRDLQSPQDGRLLAMEGENIASVLGAIAKQSPEAKRLIEAYLNKVVPSVHGVEQVSVGPMESLQFRQDVAGAKHPWKFFASNMSDGTLRALGILVALFQAQAQNGRIRLVGIEEPEVALHPAAAGVLREALQRASEFTQVLVTSHSPELLDYNFDSNQLLAVESENNVSRIAPIDEASREVLRNRLYTVGELMRLDQIRPARPVSPMFVEPRKNQADFFL